MTTSTVFISHAVSDAEIANALESALRRAFPDELIVFNVSNDESVRPGDDWWHQIENGLRECCLMLVVCSPGSVDRPWLHFEAGAAWLTDRRVIPCLARGMTATSVPAPLNHFQAVEISVGRELKALMKMVAERCGTRQSDDFDAEQIAKSFATLWQAPESPPPESLEPSEVQRRRNILAKLRQLYILSNDNITAEMMAGLAPLPKQWTEAQLEKLGEDWRQDSYT